MVPTFTLTVRSAVVPLALLLHAWVPEAVAQRPELYVRAGVGAGQAPNAGAGATNVDFDLGRPIGTLAFGVETGLWRFELDGGYRVNDAEVVFFDDGRGDVAPTASGR